MDAIGRLNFRFSLELNGIPVAQIQEIDSPDFNIGEIMQGAAGNEPNKKIPGKPTVGDLVVRKIKPIKTVDNWAWLWMAGVLRDPSASRMIGFLNEHGVDDTSIEQRFYLGEVWPKAIPGLQYRANVDPGDLLLEEITFSVRYFFPADVQGFKDIFGL